ncbi:hypothetical protein H0H92_012211 [Tricholoma furcatifolium]|nr:hypothetical protein H0H92_012211 [Tricholoma furcatifolium]
MAGPSNKPKPSKKKKQQCTASTTAATDTSAAPETASSAAIEEPQQPPAHLPAPTLTQASDMPHITGFSATSSPLMELLKSGEERVILEFLKMVAGSKEGDLLNALWDRAHREGMEMGQLTGGGSGEYDTGWLVGFHEGKDEGFEEGFEEGRRQSGSTTSSQSQRCIGIQTGGSMSTASTQTPAMPETRSVATATDPAYISPQPAALSTTASLTPPAPKILDWATDASHLPIHTLPPRDLSALCSPQASQPFSSLQRRKRRGRHFRIPYASQCHRSRVPVQGPFVTHRHPAGIAHGRPTVIISHSQSQVPDARSQFHTSTRASRIDWDRDPRLANLSHALRALGWIPP